MKNLRCVEAIILDIAIAMRADGIISSKNFLCIFVVIILITVISAVYYFKKYKQAFVEFLSEYGFFKGWKKERYELCWTDEYDENKYNFMTDLLISTGKRIIEKGTVFVNDSKMSPNQRKRIQEIMDEVNKTLETEELL